MCEMKMKNGRRRMSGNYGCRLKANGSGRSTAIAHIEGAVTTIVAAAVEITSTAAIATAAAIVVGKSRGGRNQQCDHRCRG